MLLLLFCVAASGSVARTPRPPPTTRPTHTSPCLSRPTCRSKAKAQQRELLTRRTERTSRPLARVCVRACVRACDWFGNFECFVFHSWLFIPCKRFYHVVVECVVVEDCVPSDNLYTLGQRVRSASDRGMGGCAPNSFTHSTWRPATAVATLQPGLSPSRSTRSTGWLHAVRAARQTRCCTHRLTALWLRRSPTTAVHCFRQCDHARKPASPFPATHSRRAGILG